MLNTENDLIFESYIIEQQTLISEENTALSSDFRGILKKLDREYIPSDHIFFNRAHKLIKGMNTTRESKVKIIQNLTKARENGIEGMKEYLRKAAEHYEGGGFIDKNAAKRIAAGEETKYYDHKYNRAPEYFPHFGDIVKYVGPANQMLDTNFTYIVTQKIDNPNSRAEFDQFVYHIKIYDETTNQPVNTLPVTVKNANYLRKTDNNLKRRDIRATWKQNQERQELNARRERQNDYLSTRSKQQAHDDTRSI